MTGLLHVAICDDEAAFVQHLSQLLDRYAQETGTELKISTFGDGADLTDPYDPTLDLIFLDIQMGIMDGLRTAQRIREMDGQVSIIFLTTLAQWANVRRGEKLYISPYKNRADIIFDSSLPYEVSVMKNYAKPMLEAVPEENARRSELLDLIHGFDHFLPIDPDLVPPASLIREFIGGGIYEYK